MRCPGTVIALLTLCSLTPIKAQDRIFSLKPFGTYTTSSKLFHHPDDPDPALRNEFLPLEDILGCGIELSGRFESLRLDLALSVEYMEKRRETSYPAPDGDISVTDGFSAIPVELTAYFTLPFRIGAISFFMGGGGGLYTGRRFLEIGGAASRTADQKPSFGIHVLCGAGYEISRLLSVKGELKFRDVHFESTNKFGNIPAAAAGLLTGGQTASRINIDGMTFSVGTAMHF